MAIDLGYQAEKAGNSVKDFLSSNSFIAHLVFLILVIIAFIFLLRLGTAILSWLIEPKPNVILSPGLSSGTKQEIFPGDPATKASKPIMRSQDQFRGIEFTWSVWLYIDSAGLNTNKDKFRHVFNKGNSTMGVDGIVEPNNGPGLYISPNNHPNSAELTLLVRMNIFTNESNNNPLTKLNRACLQAINAYNQDPNLDPTSGNLPPTLASCRTEWEYLNRPGGEGMHSQPLAPNIYDDIEIPEIPINKWVSVIIRCQNNNILDVYINGRLLRRHRLSGVARQNYGNTNVGLGGGFSGYRSDLRYFNYAIGTAEIDFIVENGPNLNAEGNDLGSSKPYYLANRWFNDNLDPVYGGGM